MGCGKLTLEERKIKRKMYIIKGTKLPYLKKKIKLYEDELNRLEEQLDWVRRKRK